MWPNPINLASSGFSSGFSSPRAVSTGLARAISIVKIMFVG